MSHLGDRIGALVDGELDHQTRERVLSHVAHCDVCRSELEAQRAVKCLLASAAAPPPPAATVALLHRVGDPGRPLPPRSLTAAQGPVVPDLPPPGRAPRGTRADSRRPGARGRNSRRARVVAAGALSVAGLVLGTAFVAGGAPSASNGPVVPPVAELSVEHGRTSNAVTVGDSGVGLMTTFGDLARRPTTRR